MGERVLILGGTREAVALAAALVDAGHDVTSSLAGRTKEPRPLMGRVRIGGFGGAQGLAAYLHQQQIDRLVDATHPFAVRISANAVAAAKLAGIPVERHERAPWREGPGDRWQHVGSIEEAVASLRSDERVLLALGSQHIAPFAARTDVAFLVRMVDAPAIPLALPNSQIVLGRPSADPRDEERLLAEHRIDRIVCRNSGGPGAYAKLIAARRLGLPVTMIARPSFPGS